MLVEFSVSNYRSIGDEQILSLVPSEQQQLNNILENGKYKVLNAIGIYGNNASGKSNLLSAIELLNKLLYLSARSNSTTKLPYQPFLLREGYELKPTKLEITFIIDENRYRFGLEYNKEEVLREWLYCFDATHQEVMLFEREGDIIDASEDYKGSPELINAAIEATRDNSLFISTCDMLNVSGAKLIFKWFDKLLSINGIETQREEIRTVHLWENKEYRKKIKEYLMLLNLGIHNLDIVIEDFDVAKMSDNLDKNIRNLLDKIPGGQIIKTITTHKLYNREGATTTESVNWNLDEHESEGTKKVFHLSGPIIRTLSEGGVLVIDEIEAKMHPIITINSINIFLNKVTNPYGAQIIFATHDTNILTYCPLRRDQINFVEKNNWEATEIYALSDFKYFDETNDSGVPDVDKEKRYFEGRYGAIPALGPFIEKLEKWYG
ncbi:AAA family ATPase [Candidatus Marithrix sp. Canyon 246]|uniref:AAA family ATPase n=1 Tax=Candidatus Marithrix sp. Canyon 246 TaxID=1827136 RepID=UPI000A8440CC|nr:ATP-binding protein [Candidatus Marithrix sp. Canyon 246]